MEVIQILSNSIAIFNSAILFVLLFFRKQNSLPNKMLSGIMLIPMLYFFNSILMLNGFGKSYYLFFFFVQYIAIFFTPLISSYVYLLLGYSLKKLKYVYLLCAVIGLIPLYILLQYLSYSENLKESFFYNLVEGPYPKSITFYSTIFYLIQQAIFIFLFIKVKNAIHFFSQRVSNLGTIKLIYLSNFTKLLIGLNLVIVVFYIFFDILFMEYTFLPVIISIIYSFIIYYAFKNNAIFTDVNYKNHLQLIKENTITIDETIIDNHTPSNSLVNDIQQIITQKEILEDSDLTIANFAEKLNVPVHKVSKIINANFKKNFYDLVNQERINYAKKILKENKNYTIEGVAYQAGFNSRATFYRAFKKYTNQTPSQYIATLLKD